MSRSFYLTSTSSLYSTLHGEFTPSVTSTSSQYIDLDLCLAFSFDNSNWFQEVCTISLGNVGKSGFSKSFDQRSISGEFLAEEEQETTFNVSPGEENEDAVRANSPTEAEKSGDDNESKVVESPRTKAQISQELEIEGSQTKKRIEALRFELTMLEDSFARTNDQNAWNALHGSRASDLENEVERLEALWEKQNSELQKRKNELELSAMNESNEQKLKSLALMKKMDRIVIYAFDGESKNSVLRALSPVSMYKELISQVKSMFPSLNVLYLERVSDGLLIGSQDELEFAYQDCIKAETGVLNLNLKHSKKRKRLDDDEDEEEDDEEEDEEPRMKEKVRHKGKWEFSEILLYQKAVKLFGEKKWSKIANYIGSRDKQQVRDFAATPTAQRFSIQETPISFFQETLSTAIRGLSSAVDGVRNLQSQADTE